MLYQKQDERFVEAKFHHYQAWNFPLIDEEYLGRENIFFLNINKKKYSSINSPVFVP